MNQMYNSIGSVMRHETVTKYRLMTSKKRYKSHELLDCEHVLQSKRYIISYKNNCSIKCEIDSIFALDT